MNVLLTVIARRLLGRRGNPRKVAEVDYFALLVMTCFMVGV